jgi:hypothetical protein
MSETAAKDTSFEHRNCKVILLENGKWQCDLRKIIDKGTKRPTANTKPEAKKKIDEALKNQQQYGDAGNDFLNTFTNTELFATLHEFTQFKDELPQTDIVKIVKAGIASERERLITEKFPLMATWLEDDYKPLYLEKNTSGGKQKTQTWKGIQRAIDNLNEVAKGWHINEVFHPTNRLLIKMRNHFKKLTFKRSATGGRREKEKRAGHLSKALDECLKSYPEIVYRNPLRNWKAEYAESQIQRAAKMPQSYSPELVKELLEAAAGDEKLCELIPFIVLQVYGGCRPSDIDGLDDHRVWKWSNMNNWDQISDVTSGLKFQVPAIDEDNNPMQKKAVWVDRDLHPTGLAWLQWWCYKFKGMSELPNDGSYDMKSWKPKGEALMKSLRKRCGIATKKDGYLGDGFRKTFATAIHVVRPKNEYDYWLRSCSHSGSVHAEFYKNPNMTKAAAVALFEIHPPDIQAGIDEKNQSREKEIRALMDNNNLSRADVETLMRGEETDGSSYYFNEQIWQRLDPESGDALQ